MNKQQQDLNPETLIAIGQFAEQTQLSLKALRLYHSKGLLTPAYIDPDSNYRYYASAQVQPARCIRLLREMEMPLAMIEQLLTHFATKPMDAARILQKYLDLLAARVARIQRTAGEVSQLLEEQESQMQLLTEQELCLYDLPPVARDRLLDVLKTVLDRAETLLSPKNYRLVGTTASILHGANTPARGIDFLMNDRESVDALHLALSAFTIHTPPTYLPEDQQYWASYFVDGIHVGVTTTEWEPEGNVIESSGEGPWTYYSKLPWGQHSVPTVALELRLVTELFRHRPDRYEPLIEYMRTKQVDMDLLHRGMNERQIPEAQQAEVIHQLNQSKDKS